MEEVVTLDDVLESMTLSLFNKKPEVNIASIPDRFSVKPQFFGKPLRELFYRNSIVQAAAPPPKFQPERCSCQYLCRSAIATVKCLSCALYDIKGTGYYCDLCFQARHPWYRVDHVSIPIYQN